MAKSFICYVKSFFCIQTEDEALAFALQASLADTPKSETDKQSNEPASADEDLALARAIAQSELEERNRQRQASQVINSFHFHKIEKLHFYSQYHLFKNC